MGHGTVQTEGTKKQVELLQNENKLQMESESLFKLIELLSVQQTNTHEIKDNTGNFIKVQEKVKHLQLKTFLSRS